MKLLALDTATELCSAALWLDGALQGREQLAPRAHGALILPMVDELLAEAGLGLAALDAIAFGRGPGAFTGLRLAAAVAQGLGFACDRPLIGVSDLRALAARALALRPGVSRALISQDARMEEVYWGRFEYVDGALCPAGAEAVGPPAVVELPAGWAPVAPAGAAVVGAGSGFAVYPALAARWGAALVQVLPELAPRAHEIARLAAADGLAAAVPAEQALPVYLRDRVTAP